MCEPQGDGMCEVQPVPVINNPDSSGSTSEAPTPNPWRSHQGPRNWTGTSPHAWPHFGKNTDQSANHDVTKHHTVTNQITDKTNKSKLAKSHHQRSSIHINYVGQCSRSCYPIYLTHNQQPQTTTTSWGSFLLLKRSDGALENTVVVFKLY